MQKVKIKSGITGKKCSEHSQLGQRFYSRVEFLFFINTSLSAKKRSAVDSGRANEISKKKRPSAEQDYYEKETAIESTNNKKLKLPR